MTLTAMPTEASSSVLATPALRAAAAGFAAALGDDALVLGHRLSEWSSRAPTLEEDIALSNLGLDLIGQARLFYQLAGRLETPDADAGAVAGKPPVAAPEDRLAYFRDAPEFRNVLLVELPRGDFAFTMARQLAVAAFLEPYYEALARSRVPDLAAIAAKAVKEMAYHVRHSAEWVIRLGDGTAESRRRMVAGLEAVWPYTAELFEMGADDEALVRIGAAPDRRSIRPVWERMLDRVLTEATLERPRPAAWHAGGRQGRHTEHLAPMLAEMQSLARAHPGVTW